MKCARCGEAVLDPRPVCFYCGAPVDHTVRAPVATANRFTLAEQHPEFAAAWASESTRPELRIGASLFGMLIGGVILAFGVTIGPTLHFRELQFFWWLFGILFIGVHVPKAFMGLWTALAPTRRRLVVVVDEEHRTEQIVKHAGTSRERHKTKQHHFATLQTRDGAQRRWRCSPKLAGRLSVGCIGVAITKGPSFLKFVNLPVPLA